MSAEDRGWATVEELTHYPDSGRSLAWCSTHNDVAVVYTDGSVSCRWELVVGAITDDHALVPIPAEMLGMSCGADDGPKVGEVWRCYGDPFLIATGSNIHWVSDSLARGYPWRRVGVVSWSPGEAP